MHILTRPILEIDLNNLLNNYKSLKALSRHAQAAAVVKDDAYGLHADIVAKKLYEEGGCRHFFVAHGIEGERIRNLVPEAAIYVLQGHRRRQRRFFPPLPADSGHRFAGNVRLVEGKPN